MPAIHGKTSLFVETTVPNSVFPGAAGCLCSNAAALHRPCWKRGPAVSRLQRVRRKTVRWPAHDADSGSAESILGLDPGV